MLPPLDAPLGLCGGFGWKKKTRKRNGERHFWISQTSTINLAAICTQADYNMRPLDTIYRNFMDALPVVKYCSENNKRLIHLSTCEVYGKTIGSFLPTDHRVRQVRLHFVLCLCKDQNLVLFNTSGTLWCPFCVFIFNYKLRGAENGLEFTIVRPFNWIGPRMDFIPCIDGPSEGVPKVLACFSTNLLRHEPLKLVDGGQSQRTFVYIKDAIEAVLLMITSLEREKPVFSFNLTVPKLNTVAVSPDGSLCVSGAKDGVILLWDLAEGKRLYLLDAGSIVHALCFSPNRYWLCAATEASIKIWDLESKTVVVGLRVDAKRRLR
ncbi:hypothetical protein RHMOL_Rhmol06G0261400 [Rhododendron molle]|uniref:Uncharacterized protein n=1 Tax=Rhododendron molle TaxID=49168 RepID=A0ACC0NIR6_RHOML|nr:hypothetical protein RHMOL_Rhmol06G0261400 [Rhododendron molle]